MRFQVLKWLMVFTIGLGFNTVDAQTWTWDKVVEPNNDVSVFKMYDFYPDGKGWTFQQYSSFKLFSITTDGGKTWELKATPFGGSKYDALWGVYSFDSDHIYAVFGENTYKSVSISRYSVADNEWNEVARKSFPDHNLNLATSDITWMKGISEDMLYGTVRAMDNATSKMEDHPFIFKNGGADHMAIRDKMTDEFDYVVDLQFHDDKNGVMMTKTKFKFTLYHTADGGETWSNKGIVEGDDYSQIEMVDEDNYIVALEDELYITKDGGSTWSTKSIDDNVFKVYDVSFADPSCGIVINRDRKRQFHILRTSDGGDSWVQDSVSHDIEGFSSGTEIYEVKHFGCETWYAAAIHHIISNSEFPFKGEVGFDDKAVNPRTGFYPNPANDFVRFGSQVSSYQICDMSGRVFLAGIEANQVDIASLETGCYLLMMNDGEALKTATLVVE